MEAHEALERQRRISGEEHHHAGDVLEPDGSRGLAQQAAVLTSVIAVFLAIATFLSNEAIKEAIQGETKAADTSAKLEANSTKTTIAENDAVLLRAISAGGTHAQTVAAEKAEQLEARVVRQYGPTDARLAEEIKADHHARDQADTDHFFYELAQVALQIAIVLAGVSILVRKRWLLAGGAGVALAGVVLLAIGLVI